MVRRFELCFSRRIAAQEARDLAPNRATRHKRRDPMIRAVLLCAAFYCAGALAQAYPPKPIRMVLTFPPGASSDVVGRMLGQKISESMGVQWVADNRAGAGGNLGTAVA